MLVWAAISRIPSTGWLKQHLFLTVLEVKSKVNSLAGLVPGGGWLPGSLTAVFPVAERENAGLHEDISGALPTKDLNQIQLRPKGPTSNTITQRFRLPHMNLQVGPTDTNTQSIAGSDDVWSEV